MGVSPRTIIWEEFAAAGTAGVRAIRLVSHGETGIHDHTFREIVYIESGTAEHITSGPPHQLQPGDLIVIRPLVWHGYHRPRNLTLINCLIDRRLMHTLEPLLADVEGAFELFRKPVRRDRRGAPVVLHARPGQRPGVVEPLRRIMTEQREQAPGWKAAASAALLDLLVATARLSCRQLPEPPAVSSGRAAQAVLQTVGYLEANFTAPVHLFELAARQQISPAHLCRSFSRRMGMGMVEFVHQLRCEEACRLLRSTDLPIARIATHVGYDEIAYFSRCFRRQTGRSPREYRRLPSVSPA